MSQLLERAKQNAQKREDSLLKNKGHLVLLFAALAAASGPILGLLAVIFFLVFLSSSFKNQILIEEFKKEELLEENPKICLGAIKAWAYALGYKNAKQMFSSFQNFGKRRKERKENMKGEGGSLLSHFSLSLFLFSFIYFLLFPAEAHAAVGGDIDPSSILLGSTILTGINTQAKEAKDMTADQLSQQYAKLDYKEKRKFIKNYFGKAFQNPKVTALDQFFNEEIQKMKEKEVQVQNNNSSTYQKISKNLNAKSSQQIKILKKKTDLKEGYVLNSCLTFVRRSASNGAVSNLNSDNPHFMGWLEQKSQTSMGVIHGVSGDYNAAIYTVGKWLGLTDDDIDGSNIIKVVSPQQATAEEKRFIVKTMANLGYTVYSDGFYLKNGSNVATKFAELAVDLFGNGKDAMLQVRSYFRGAISTPAIKSLTDMPVVVVSKGDSYFDNCVAAESTDGGAICTYHLVNDRFAFQFRYFGDAENDGNIRFAKGLATQAKVVWCVQDSKMVSLEEVGFDKNGAFEQTINGKTYIGGLFLNGSMFKGQHKKAIEVGMRLDGILNIIAEDNNLPAYTHFGWQNNVNLNMSGEVQIAIKNIYGDLAGKYLMKDNPLFNYLSLNAARINRINTNGLVRVQSTYVQTANLGGNANASRGDEGIAYALMPTNKDGKPLSVAMMATGRQPQQQWSSHGLVKAYSPSFAIKTLEMAKDSFTFDAIKDKARIEYLATLGKRFDWLKVDENGAVTVTDRNGLNQYLFFLKCVIAPSVQQNILWVDYTLQAIINGDNDGDKNWYSFDKDIVALVKAMLRPDGNTMVKKATESSKKLLAASPNLDIKDWINQDVNHQGYVNCITYLAASGGSPGQGNVGAITNMVGAFNAHLPFFDSKNEFAPIGHLIQLVEYVYQVQQIAIDWQKYYYYAVSLKNWHLWTPGKLSIPGYTYLVPGQKQRVSDEIVKRYNLTADDFNKVDLEGYSAHLAENYSPSTWVEVFPSFKGDMEITDTDVMYSSGGVYLWGMWVVNCFKVATLKNVDAKVLWSQWLSNDMAKMREIAALDPKADEFKVELNKLLGVTDYNWIIASELTTWTKNNTVWGENTAIAVPKQISLMLSSIRDAFHNKAVSLNICKKESDMFSEIRDSFIKDYAHLEGRSCISYKENKKTTVNLTDGKEKYFLTAIMNAFKVSQAEALDGVTQSVKAQGSNANSAAASLRLLIQAAGRYIEDIDGVDLNKVRMLLSESLPLNTRFTTDQKEKILGMFKDAAIKALVGIAKDEKRLQVLDANIIDFGNPNNPKHNQNKHAKNLEEREKLVQKFNESLYDLQAFLADDFLPAIDQSLENQNKDLVVQKMVNDQIINCFNACIKENKTVEETIAALKVVEAEERNNLFLSLSKINDELIALRDKAPKLNDDDKKDPTKLAEYNSNLAKHNATVEIKAMNSKEYQDALTALNYFQKVYRALTWYNDTEKAFDACTETNNLWIGDKREKFTSLRTSILYDLNNETRSQMIKSFIDAGIDISLLSHTIEDYSVEMQSLIIRKDLEEGFDPQEIANFVKNNPVSKVLKTKPAYIYIAGKELRGMGVDTKVVADFYCDFGFGTMYKGSDFDFILNNEYELVDKKSKAVMRQVENNLRKIEVEYSFIDINGEKSEDLKEVIVLPNLYSTFNSYNNCEIIKDIRYYVSSALAEETGTKYSSDMDADAKKQLNGNYKEIFGIANPFAGAAEAYHNKKVANSIGGGIAAKNIFAVNNPQVVKASSFTDIDLLQRRLDDDIVDSDTKFFLNLDKTEKLSLKDLAFNYASYINSQNNGICNVGVLLALAGLENYIDTRLLNAESNIANDDDQNKKDMHAAMFKKVVKDLPASNIRQFLRNHDLFEKEDSFVSIKSLVAVDSKIETAFFEKLIEIVLGSTLTND